MANCKPYHCRVEVGAVERDRQIWSTALLRPAISANRDIEGANDAKYNSMLQFPTSL